MNKLFLFSFLLLSACGARVESESLVSKEGLSLPLERTSALENKLKDLSAKLGLNASAFQIGELPLETMRTFIPTLPRTVRGFCLIQGEERILALTEGREEHYDLSILLHELGHCAFQLKHLEQGSGFPYHVVNGFLIPKDVMDPHFIVEDEILESCEEVFIQNLLTRKPIERRDLRLCLEKRAAPSGSYGDTN